jgi:hypothetical protein
MNAYDLVGDIHGYASKLEALLSLLGYTKVGRRYKAPLGRQAVFLGDLIDRGPEQMRVLEIVRSMVDAGDALCIMGNHEFNAIGFATEDPLNSGERLRPNRGNTVKCRKNREQHTEFLAQVVEGSAEYLGWIEWFKTLPPFMDLGGIRVVHGCWDEAAVATLKAAGWGVSGSILSDQLLMQIGRIVPEDQETPLIKARKLLTCGLEIPLPSGKFIEGKDGHKFYDVRIANWRDWATELQQVALVPAGQEELLKGMEWPAELVISAIEGAPIFVGHHWFSGHPVIESPKLACLDWSAAKDGPLVAYRWDGESELVNEKLAWVGAV